MPNTSFPFSHTSNSGSENAPAQPADTVDARGLACPMPLLKAKLALNGVNVGAVVKVLATDAGSVRDFHAFTRLSAHTMLSFVEHDEYYEYLLEKGKQP